MLPKVFMTSAVALFLAVVVCSITPGCHDKAASGDDAAPATFRGKLTGQSLRGVSLSIHNVDDIRPYLKCIDEIAEVGADTVEFVVTTRQENGSSTTIWVDQRYCPSKAQLLELMAHAKEKKLRVILMPVVLPHAPKGNEWRGTFKPDSWMEWFDNYRVMLRHFARICEEGQAFALVVGSELVSSEVHTQEWKRTIAMARKEFPSGKLTYSANWDHYANIGYWEDLDFIGMNSYWKLGENQNVTVEQIIANWRQIQKELINFSNAKQMPIVLLEVGWCSISNAAHEPWDYTRSDLTADWDLQKRLYEGFFQSWYGNPHLGGFMVWEWLPSGDTIEKDDKTYIPKGKPAYPVLKQWLAKGPWEVK